MFVHIGNFYTGTLFLMLERLHQSCGSITLVVYAMCVELIILGMIDFNIILGMDWIHRVFDCGTPCQDFV